MLYLLCKNKEVLSLDLSLLEIPNCQCPQIFPLRREGLVSPEADAPTSYLERHPLLYVTWPAGERDGRFTTKMQTLINTLMSLSSLDLCPLCLRCVWNTLSPLVPHALYMLLPILQCLQGCGWQASIFLITPTPFQLNCSDPFFFH